MTLTAVPPQAATLPVIRALLDEAGRKGYQSGVLGVRARPEWSGGDTFVHAEVPVRVVACVSTLAVREALIGRDQAQWLVVLTDRPEGDLGAGLLGHLVWHRLRTPDPWDAVRHRFAATGIDPALTGLSNHREVATGLLTATPPAGWPPAPGGVLTRDHALGSVTRAHLGLADPVVDLSSVLTWTTDPAVVSLVADLRTLGGNPLTDAVLSWVVGNAGSAGPALLPLLRAGEGRDSVPLGLVAGLLGEAAAGLGGESEVLARVALARLEPRLGGTVPTTAVLRSWSSESAAVVVELLRDSANRSAAGALLKRADDLLDGAQAPALAEESDLLPAGLTRRLAGLATALRAAAQRIPAGDLDASQVGAAELAAVETAWARVVTHRLADTDARTAAFHAAVRLTRWLATTSGVTTAELRDLVHRHADCDAWVDSATNDAAAGASDPELGAGLAAVLTAARARRAAHDVTFAEALARHTSDDPPAAAGIHAGVWHLEEVLPGIVLPLARTAPVLLLVLDGMSAAVGAEVVTGVLARNGDGWAEALLPRQDRRASALAVLPTLTTLSRSSLLCGELRTGGPDVEQRGYSELTRAHGLPGAALFHKKGLDSSPLGYAVAHDVSAAIADVDGHPLVTCVLNTIDDALDRSDPGGIDWSGDTVKHLNPLLDRARNAGRTVILTADHGHIIERRQGAMRRYATISSGRSRAANEPAGEGEVLVAGRRVLEPGAQAVLAVDEHLRYGPLKAGYHGGAAPAEAIVPVTVLVPGAIPEGADLRLAPPQEPAWWIDRAAPVVASVRTPARPAVEAPRSAPTRSRKSDTGAPTLFDEPEPTPVSPASAVEVGPEQATVAAVLKSPAYAAQKKIAGRVSTTDAQIRALLIALLTAPGHRLPPAQAASVLAVAPISLRGAVLHVQRLLNVEGYAVLRVDADGVTIVLDETLLRDQFGMDA